MKFKVIGWTNYDDERYPWRDGSVAIDKVVGEALREGGYRFCGDAHQYHEGCVPVLNDGKRVLYSMRSWGQVMADALNEEGGNWDYMDWYMHLGEETGMKYPRPYVDESKIVPFESIAETFQMKLNDLYFDLVRQGKKSVEVRLFDEKRQMISPGDYIIFSRAGDERDKLKVRVKYMAECYAFSELFDMFRPEEFGYSEKCTSLQFQEDMYKIYTREQVDKYGVVGIVIEVISDQT